MTPALAPIHFEPGETTHTFGFDERISAGFGDGSTRSDTLQVTAPTPASFTHASYAFTCERHVLSAVLTATSPTMWSAPCANSPNFLDGYTFNVALTVTLTPGPDTPLIMDYAISPSAIVGWSWHLFVPTLPGEQDTRSGTGQITLRQGSPNGIYTLTVTGTAPESFSSNALTVTKNC